MFSMVCGVRHIHVCDFCDFSMASDADVGKCSGLSTVYLSAAYLHSILDLWAIRAKQAVSASHERVQVSLCTTKSLANLAAPEPQVWPYT